MTALDRVVAALEATGCKPRRNGSGWSALCPAHDDRNPSLAFSNGGGRVLLRCHAGCAASAVVEALGLRLGDLFDEQRTERREVARYRYDDENGRHLFSVVRFDPKDFRQQAADGAWSTKGIRKPLYRLPAVLAAVAAGDTVYICEGERDADSINNAPDLVNVVATTNPGGAGKWRPEHTAALKGARVVVVADRDEAGRNHAREVAKALRPVVASLRVVEAAEGKDASDHLAAGLALAQLADVTSAYLDEKDDAPRLAFVSFADVAAKVCAPAPCLLPGWAVQDIHVKAGPYYVGKNYEGFEIAMQAASGLPIFGHDDWRVPTPLNSLFVEEEMTQDETQPYLQRLAAGLGLDLDALRPRLGLVGFCSGWHFGCESDLHALYEMLRTRAAAGYPVHLLWLDSISQVADIPKQASVEDVRAWFRHRLQPIRREFGCGIVAYHHCNKLVFAKARPVDDEGLVSGSEAFVSAANSGSITLRAKADDQRVFRMLKGRTGGGRRGRWAFRYKFVNAPGPADPLRLWYAGDLDEDQAQEETRAETVSEQLEAYLRARPGLLFTAKQIEGQNFNRKHCWRLPADLQHPQGPGAATLFGLKDKDG